MVKDKQDGLQNILDFFEIPNHLEHFKVLCQYFHPSPFQIPPGSSEGYKWPGLHNIYQFFLIIDGETAQASSNAMGIRISELLIENMHYHSGFLKLIPSHHEVWRFKYLLSNSYIHPSNMHFKGCI